ncbi:MAG: hypothetical protein H6626_02805 [Pseudobdellovibrionaceae bacterium]|nr:MAG: hypothetical protein H6626_02805 [Pseudobdellovibrionaceae bacterium]
MENIEHLTPTKVQKVAERISSVSSSLNGVGSLFRFQAQESCIDGDEYAGIGILLQEFSKELMRVEDILRCGFDSLAKSECDETMKG